MIQAPTAIQAFRATRSYERAEKELGFVAVCLIGPNRMQPITGANSMWWPVRINTSVELTKAAERADIENWADDVYVLDHAWVGSHPHANRVKKELQRMLFGDGDDLKHRRKNWVDCPDWQVVFPLLLSEAHRIIEARGESLEIFDDGERDQIIWDYARRRVRA